ncbi:MAG: DUF5777 family beta-barrel protein [Bacteroidales bacterium]|nr:DUF5777 family beta-barrel protein [Bacteroidales bacterium]
MKKYLLIGLSLIIGIGVGYSQDEETKPEKKKDRPVTEMFGSGMLIDAQTSVIPPKKTLESQIQHRFGLIKNNGISDLFGIYAPSANTRIGLNYSILDNLVVGYGITRKNMYSDFQVKWAFLRQTRNNTIPLTIAVYANMAIDGRNKDVFNTATADSAFKFSNRFSYFTQLIVGRKFTDWFSLELTASFTHYNSVQAETPNVKGYEHDVVGFGGHLRFKFSPQSSILIMYTKPVFIEGLSENYEVMNTWYSNFGIAYEVATVSHAFQIFFTTANGILSQDTYMYNTNEWTKGEFRIGFNITRLWEF